VYNIGENINFDVIYFSVQNFVLEIFAFCKTLSKTKGGEIIVPKTKEDPKANVNGKMCKTQIRKGSDAMSTKILI
jgi:hypothetical protein